MPKPFTIHTALVIFHYISDNPNGCTMQLTAPKNPNQINSDGSMLGQRKQFQKFTAITFVFDSEEANRSVLSQFNNITSNSSLCN